MSVQFTLENLANISVSVANRTRDIPDLRGPSRVPSVDEGRQDVVDARNELLALYRVVDAVAEMLDIETHRFQLDLPDARSDPALSLNLSETAAFLTSNEEINASPNSFTPFGPDWRLGSTSLITISGAYDGSNGSGTLSFEANRIGVRGVDNLQVRVRDPLGGIIGNYNFRRTDPLDLAADLGNGLFFTLGSGTLLAADTASVDVSQGVGSAVDPDEPLAGTRNDNPNFQFYPAPHTLPDIVDGAFEINGESIAVDTSDTILTVLDRINISDAGVTATFNAVTERIEFTQNSTGSLPTIDLRNDTSNFVKATKLDSATLTPGTDSEARLTLDSVADFSGIVAGDILINGTPISIDTASDSLETVIDKVNASGAGVTARFDESAQVVSIEALDENASLELDGNGTGLFSALNIVEGRVDPKIARGGISKRRSYRIADAIEALALEINRIFDNSEIGSGTKSLIGGVRADITSAVSAALGLDERLAQGRYGIRFNTPGTPNRADSIVDIDRRRLTHYLQRNGGDLKRVFLGRGDDAGLLERLYRSTRLALEQFNRRLGMSGSVVDVYA